MGKVNHLVPLSTSVSDEALKAAPTEGTVYFSAPLYSEDFLFLFVT
jgi:hypothetical protein